MILANATSACARERERERERTSWTGKNCGGGDGERMKRYMVRGYVHAAVDAITSFH
jgi:hypothetical protein